MKKFVLKFITLTLVTSSVFSCILTALPEGIEISREGIFAFIDNEWVEVDSLYRTAHGQYEVELKAEEMSKGSTSWVCPHCTEVNGFHRRTCKKCGKHPMQT